MSNIKYVAFDVHLSTISVAVLNSEGKLVTQAVIETDANAILDFLRGLSGVVHLTFEEGTQAQWLYELTHTLVTEIVVCNPRQNHSLKSGNKSDKLDARKLAELLRAGLLKSVYHGSASTQTLKQLVHNYDSLTSDTTRCMNRIKSIFRSRGIGHLGRDVYYNRNRTDWLEKLTEPGQRLRSEFLLNQLDRLKPLRREARKAMIEEARRHSAFKIVSAMPALGPVRVAQIIAAVGSPFRFRTKRQFWTYCGFAVVTRSSADYQIIGGKMERVNKNVQTRGLNPNFNHRLKVVFKSAALEALKDETIRKIYDRLMAKGIKPEMARLTIARKLAAVTLAIWKKGEEYDSEKLTKITE